MKLLLCAIIVAISCQVILCDDANLVRMINTAVPQIIQGGITEGKLPGGTYYLHHIIKSSIGAQNSHLTLDVRQLDNQTVVTVKATIDNTDFSVKNSCFTSKIGENIMALTQGWGFTWLSYAPSGPGDYCFDIDDQEWFYVPGAYYPVRSDQLALDNVIKLTYDILEETKNGDWKRDILDELDPKIPMGPLMLEVGRDYVTLSQYVGRDTYGMYDTYFFIDYQPCTGHQHVSYNVIEAS